MSFHVLVLIHKQLPFFYFIFYFCKRQEESLSNAGLYLHRVTQSCWLSFFLPNFFWHMVLLLLSEMCLRVCGMIKDPVWVLSHCGSSPQSQADLLRGRHIARGWLRRRWDGVLHSDEHLTSTSSQKTAKCRPESSGTTLACFVYGNVRLEFKQIQHIHTHAHILPN